MARNPSPDWSNLPRELLKLVSERLDCELNLLRFRSVCSSWRFSTPGHRHHVLPAVLPYVQHFSFSRRSIFLVTPPPLPPQDGPEVSPPQDPENREIHRYSWIIKVGQDENGQTRLYHPISGDRPLPVQFPMLDFNDLSVHYLGHEIIFVDQPREITGPFMKKVAGASWQGEENFLLLVPRTSLADVFEDTAWIFSGLNANEHREFHYMKIPSPICTDICSHKGRPYAVNNTGWTTMIRSDGNTNLIAGHVFGGEKKFLVESQGDLFLVDQHLLCKHNPCEHHSKWLREHYGNRFRLLPCKRVEKFDVYRLDEKEKTWVPLTSFEYKILFVGDHTAFFASVWDVYPALKNVGSKVVFRNGDAEMCCYDLCFNFVFPLHELSRFDNLFWPPPSWVWVGLHQGF